MSKLSGLAGTPWHITYLKSDEPGKRRDRRSCRYYIKGNECTKYGICKGGRYCTEYERDNGEAIIDKSKITAEEINQILKNIKENESIVKPLDVIVIKSLTTGKIYRIKIIEGIRGDGKKIIKKCLNKKVGFKFEYNNDDFEIVDLKKKGISADKKLPKLSKKKKSKLNIEDPANIVKDTTIDKTRKVAKPIAEENDIFHFKTQACKKGAPYSEETLIIKKEQKEYNELIKRCIGKEVGYRCKFQNKMYKLIYIEKNK